MNNKIKKVFVKKENDILYYRIKVCGGKFGFENKEDLIRFAIQNNYELEF